MLILCENQVIFMETLCFLTSNLCENLGKPMASSWQIDVNSMLVSKIRTLAQYAKKFC
jgi:hypothetical protein